MYSMWKIMFFNLKPRKHIALHQIHQIMLFLATSYDPLKIIFREHSVNVGSICVVIKTIDLEIIMCRLFFG